MSDDEEHQIPHYPHLTVGGLLELLRQMPADAPLRIEGCDCSGNAIGVDEPDEDGVVEIRRCMDPYG